MKFCSNFAYSSTVTPIPSGEYSGIKMSVLSPTQPVFTVILLTVLQWVLQMLSYSERCLKRGISTIFYIVPTIMPSLFVEKPNTMLPFPWSPENMCFGVSHLTTY